MNQKYIASNPNQMAAAIFQQQQLQQQYLGMGQQQFGFPIGGSAQQQQQQMQQLQQMQQMFPFNANIPRQTGADLIQLLQQQQQQQLLQQQQQQKQQNSFQNTQLYQNMITQQLFQVQGGVGQSFGLTDQFNSQMMNEQLKQQQQQLLMQTMQQQAISFSPEIAENLLLAEAQKIAQHQQSSQQKMLNSPIISELVLAQHKQQLLMLQQQRAAQLKALSVSVDVIPRQNEEEEQKNLQLQGSFQEQGNQQQSRNQINQSILNQIPIGDDNQISMPIKEVFSQNLQNATGITSSMLEGHEMQKKEKVNVNTIQKLEEFKDIEEDEVQEIIPSPPENIKTNGICQINDKKEIDNKPKKQQQKSENLNNLAQDTNKIEENDERKILIGNKVNQIFDLKKKVNLTQGQKKCKLPQQTEETNQIKENVPRACDNNFCKKESLNLSSVYSKRFDDKLYWFCPECFECFNNAYHCDYCEQVYENNESCSDVKEWVGCESCTKWNHVDCEVMDKNDSRIKKVYKLKDFKYYCMNCLLKRNKKTTNINDSIIMNGNIQTLPNRNGQEGGKNEKAKLTPQKRRMCISNDNEKASSQLCRNVEISSEFYYDISGPYKRRKESVKDSDQLVEDILPSRRKYETFFHHPTFNYFQYFINELAFGVKLVLNEEFIKSDLDSFRCCIDDQFKEKFENEQQQREIARKRKEESDIQRYKLIQQRKQLYLQRIKERQQDDGNSESAVEEDEDDVEEGKEEQPDNAEDLQDRKNDNNDHPISEQSQERCIEDENAQKDENNINETKKVDEQITRMNTRRRRENNIKEIVEQDVQDINMTRRRRRNNRISMTPHSEGLELIRNGKAKSVNIEEEEGKYDGENNTTDITNDQTDAPSTERKVEEGANNQKRGNPQIKGMKRNSKENEEEQMRSVTQFDEEEESDEDEGEDEEVQQKEEKENEEEDDQNEIKDSNDDKGKEQEQRQNSRYSSRKSIKTFQQNTRSQKKSTPHSRFNSYKNKLRTATSDKITRNGTLFNSTPMKPTRTGRTSS